MGKIRIRIRKDRGSWTGKLDGEDVTLYPGDEADVPIEVVRALVTQYDKAELVPVEEIIAKAKEEQKKADGPEVIDDKPKASKTKARRKPNSDKMTRTSQQK